MQPLKGPGFPIRLALIFVLLSIGIAVAGFLYYENQRKSIEGRRNEALTAITDLKLSQLEMWRRERLADAAFVRENPIVTKTIGRLLQPHPLSVPGRDLTRDLLGWMTDYQERHGYANILLLDRNGVLRLSALPPSRPVPSRTSSLATSAIESATVILSDLHRESDNAIRMELCVPISVPEAPAPIGALVLEIDPAVSLY